MTIPEKIYIIKENGLVAEYYFVERLEKSMEYAIYCSESGDKPIKVSLPDLTKGVLRSISTSKESAIKEAIRRANVAIKLLEERLKRDEGCTK